MRGSLARDALHHVAVAAQRVDVVVEQLEAGPVEVAGEPAGPDRHADAGGGALAQRAGRGLDAGGQPVLGMPRAWAVELPEALQIVQRRPRPRPSAIRLHAGEVQKGIEQHRRMPARQHEAITIEPGRVGGIEAQEVLPERVGDRGERHRRAWMARVRLLHRIHGQGADRVDAQAVERKLARRARGPIGIGPDEEKLP